MTGSRRRSVRRRRDPGWSADRPATEVRGASRSAGLRSLRDPGRCRGDPPPGRVRRAGHPGRGSRQEGTLGHHPRFGPVRRRTPRRQPRWRLQQPQRREAGRDAEPARGGRQGPVLPSGGDLGRRHREFLGGGHGPAGARIRQAQGGQRTCDLRLEQRVRKDRTVLAVQDVRPDRPGSVRFDLHRGTPRPSTRRMGLLVHGPHGRGLHGLRHFGRTGEPEPYRHVARPSISRAPTLVSRWPGPSCSTSR